MAGLQEGGTESGGSLVTLRSAADLPASRKKRAVVSEHKDKRKQLRTVGQKIKLLKREGKSQKQSVAIALSMQRSGKLSK